MALKFGPRFFAAQIKQTGRDETQSDFTRVQFVDNKAIQVLEQKCSDQVYLRRLTNELQPVGRSKDYVRPFYVQTDLDTTG